MSGCLLAIALGPVQDFIAAARRTHDLWFGSHLLSEISKAAASSLHEAGARLIFPAPENPAKELVPGSALNVSNKLLAEVPEGLAPAELAARARKAAEARWSEFADDALGNIGSAAAAAIRFDLWEEQLKDVLEFYAAWTSLGDDYTAARTRVERLLAGRKALRDFAPGAGRTGLRKSALDGARETVLTNATQSEAPEGILLRRQLRLKRGEYLDAIGLIKRRAVGSAREGGVRFVSVSRVAADVWIRRQMATDEGRALLREIETKCHSAFADPFHDPAFRDFPRECDVLFESRRQVLLNDPDLTDHREALTRIGDLLRDSGMKGPSPYFALLAADGDRIGAAISALSSAAEHRGLSRQLARFAQAARTIVTDCHGSLVYAGGDDVLAFLPIDTCLVAARRLHDGFKQLLTGVAPEATLSVGVSVGHSLEPLDDLLAMARTAEREAKQGSSPGAPDECDGLAINFWTRGGSAIKVRAQWGSSPEEGPDARLHRWIDLFQAGALPDKAAYDLQALAREYESWREIELTPGAFGELMRADALRVLRKKQMKEAEGKAELELLLGIIAAPKDLVRLAAELQLARHLAVELARAGEAPSSEPAPGGRGDQA